MRRLNLLSAILLMSVSCRSSLRDIDSKKFSYEVQEVRPRIALALPPSASTIEADAVLQVRNDNDARVKLEGIDFELLVNDKVAMKGRTTEQVDLPAHGTGLLQLRARTTGEELRGLIGPIADRYLGGDTRFIIRGTAHYRTFLGVMIDIPFSANAKTIVRQ